MSHTQSRSTHKRLHLCQFQGQGAYYIQFRNISTGLCRSARFSLYICSLFYLIVSLDAGAVPSSQYNCYVAGLISVAPLRKFKTRVFSQHVASHHHTHSSDRPPMRPWFWVAVRESWKVRLKQKYPGMGSPYQSNSAACSRPPYLKFCFLLKGLKLRLTFEARCYRPN